MIEPMRTSSPYPMISVGEALETILRRAQALPAAEFDFTETLGLVLAQDIHADEDLPSGPRSAVDGYAVAAPLEPSTLEVLGELTAGRVSEASVARGQTLRIMTGGLLPPGADAVVMVEDTEEANGIVQIKRGAEVGENVHPTGQDLVRGQLVLRAGQQLGPAEIGMLAAVGQVRVRAHRRPRIAILATGDELVEPDQQPAPGCLRDSNRFALVAAAREAGGEVVWQAHGRDDQAALEGLVREGLAAADVLITSGGVSMGTRDLIKPLLASLGEVQFGRIAFKPGKPLTFVTIGDKLAFGLPGYPVSSLVTFEVFVRPALRRMLGHERVLRTRVSAVLEHDIRPDRSRLEYHRAVVTWVDGRLTAHSTGGQSSSRLLSMVGSNALLEIPVGDAILRAGETVSALLTGEPLS
jgi:molybdopterin molybdotransferase